MKILKKFALIIPVFALGAGLIGMRAHGNQIIETEAAISTTNEPAIKVKVINTSEWNPILTISGLYVFNPTVDEGWTYSPSSSFGVNETLDESEEHVFPWYVSKVNLIVIGDQNGSQKQTIDVLNIGPGSYTLTIDGSGEGDPWKLNVTTNRLGDYSTPVYNTATNTGGVDGSRVRLWVDRGNSYGYPGFAVLNVDDVLYKPSGYVEKHGGYYYAYYDIALTTIYDKQIKFHKLSDDQTTLLKTSASVTYAYGDNSYLYKIGDDDTNTLTKQLAVTGTVKNTFLGAVLEGYLTCSSSTDNGYGAFSIMDASFLPKTSPTEWNMEGLLGNVTIDDYDGVGTSVYSSSRGTGEPTNALTKYNTLKYMSENSGQFPPTQQQSDVITNIPASVTYRNGAAIMLTAVLLSIATGLYFVFRKRTIS